MTKGNIFLRIFGFLRSKNFVKKIYFPDREISLALFLDYLLYNFFLLIRSFTTGSGTFILSRWSLQTQFITGSYEVPISYL